MMIEVHVSVFQAYMVATRLRECLLTCFLRMGDVRSPPIRLRHREYAGLKSSLRRGKAYANDDFFVVLPCFSGFCGLETRFIITISLRNVSA